MQQYRPSVNATPPVIKNLLIINILMWVLTIVLYFMNDTVLTSVLGLYNLQSPEFQPFQIVTHMFMHAFLDAKGGIYLWHIGFNMFALWMFGRVLEDLWGPKRFLLFYLVCGLGAAAMTLLYNAYEINRLQDVVQGEGYTTAYVQLQQLLRTPMVGASGAIYGVLIGFAYLFPNTLLYIYFLFPIKAKYAMIFLVGLEIYLQIQNDPTDFVAHIAHLGGALFGFILIKYWQRNRRHFY